MNLGEVQDYAFQRLTADTALTDASVILEDGSFPMTPGVEDALKTTGLAIIVFQIEAVSARSVTPSGQTVITVECPVIVQENQKICRAAGGAGITADEAVQLVQERILGSGSLVNAQQRFRAARNGFENFGKLNGLNCRYVGFEIDVVVTPRA